MATRASWTSTLDMPTRTWSASTDSGRSERDGGVGGRSSTSTAGKAGNRFLREQPRREGECSLFVKYSSPTNPMCESIPTRYLPRSGHPAHAHAVFPQFAEVSDSCVAPSLVAPRPVSREIIQSRPSSVSALRSPLRTKLGGRPFARDPRQRTSKTGTLMETVRPKFAEAVWQPQTTSPVGKGVGWTFPPHWPGA